MADDLYEVDWSPEAKELLGMRDRFTRVAIVNDFKENPEKDAVALDPDTSGAAIEGLPWGFHLSRTACANRCGAGKPSRKSALRCSLPALG